MQAEKTIVYVSRASFSLNGAAVPIGLSTIHHKSNRMNQERGITGMLSFRKGRYIQLLEGPRKEVDALFQKISSDQRHQSVQVLLNTATTARIYPGHGMKLVTSPQSDTQLKALVDSADLTRLTDSARQFVSTLFASSRHSSRAAGKDLSKQSYSMRGWPDFSRVAATPELIEFCSLLNREHCRYQDLLSMNIFHSREALDANLLDLKRLGVLHTKPIVAKADEEVLVATGQAPASSSFFKKMGYFLGLSGV